MKETLKKPVLQNQAKLKLIRVFQLKNEEEGIQLINFSFSSQMKYLFLSSKRDAERMRLKQQANAEKAAVEGTKK